MDKKQKLQKIRRELNDWKKHQPSPSVEIDAEGLTNALLAGREAEKRREYDRAIIVWFHLVKTNLGPRAAFPNIPLSKRRLFEVMNTATNQALFKRGVKKFDTDEVPTDFMRGLYEEFKQWQAEHPRKSRT